MICGMLRKDQQAAGDPDVAASIPVRSLCRWNGADVLLDLVGHGHHENHVWQFEATMTIRHVQHASMPIRFTIQQEHNLACGHSLRARGPLGSS